jgi:hypothetical protein
MIELNISTVARLLTDAVADRGADYEYRPISDGQGSTDCAYVHGTDHVAVDLDLDGEEILEEQVVGDLAPGCIVGHALISAGISPLKFIELKINRNTGVFGALGALADDGLLTFTEGAAQIFSDVQSLQDQRVLWGKAVTQVLDGQD